MNLQFIQLVVLALVQWVRVDIQLLTPSIHPVMGTPTLDQMRPKATRYDVRQNDTMKERYTHHLECEYRKLVTSMVSPCEAQKGGLEYIPHSGSTPIFHLVIGLTTFSPGSGLATQEKAKRSSNLGFEKSNLALLSLCSLIESWLVMLRGKGEEDGKRQVNQLMMTALRSDKKKVKLRPMVWDIPGIYSAEVCYVSF